MTETVDGGSAIGPTSLLSAFQAHGELHFQVVQRGLATTSDQWVRSRSDSATSSLEHSLLWSYCYFCHSNRQHLKWWLLHKGHVVWARNKPLLLQATMISQLFVTAAWPCLSWVIMIINFHGVIYSKHFVCPFSSNSNRQDGFSSILEVQMKILKCREVKLP